MLKLKNIVDTKEFVERVTNKLYNTNKTIQGEDLYFTQTRLGCCLEYRPHYPENSSADFLIYQDPAGTISLHGNMDSPIPTVRVFENLDAFEERL